MSNLVINDLAFLTELDDRETNIQGGALAGASAAADRDDALASSGASSRRGKLLATAGTYGRDIFAEVEITEYRRRRHHSW